jgi:hypothetical protein
MLHSFIDELLALYKNRFNILYLFPTIFLDISAGRCK